MTNEKMAKLAASLERAEARLLRAITKWMKLRRQVKAAGAKLDKGLVEKLEKLPGEMDVRKLPIKPKPWPVPLKVHKVTSMPVGKGRKPRSKR
jgi:hypothetical protein